MNLIDLTGQRFGKLVVVSLLPKGESSRTKWLCKCDCGNEAKVLGINLTRGFTISCKCYQTECIRKRSITHGDSINKKVSSEYKSWCHLKERCYNENCKDYINYGGRGIKVCDRWLGENGFSNFLLDMGRKPSKNHSIDRWPNNDGDYEPDNCRWGTRKQQNTTRRNNKWLEYLGEKMVLRDWAKRLGVDSSQINFHLKKNRPFEYIVEHFQKRKEKCHQSQ